MPARRHLTVAATLLVVDAAAALAGARTTLDRRAVLSAGGASSAALFVAPWSLSPAPAVAAPTEWKDSVNKEFKYELAYPSDWTDAGKPVKTHLHETLISGGTGGVKIGITIDPVKIDSLEAFGTLDQTTERVLGVEKTRDGVESVTLRSNAAEAADESAGTPSYYTIEWLTVSSRGTKVFSCKYCIANQKLYVLQAQAKADAFDGDDSTVRDTLRQIVASFRVRRA